MLGESLKVLLRALPARVTSDQPCNQVGTALHAPIRDGLVHVRH